MYSIAFPDRWLAGRLLLALLTGVMATGSGVALLTTSAWLITAASFQPPVLLLMVPIVAVRAFGVGRGVFRYFERLVGHDAAYRVLGEIRARLTARLEELLPAGLDVRRGDLLARVVLDVDAVLDLWLRVVLPVLVALVTATATVAVIAVLLPTAGVAAALAVLTACTLVPSLTVSTARRSERSMAEYRGDVGARAIEDLHSAADVIAFGAVDEVLMAFAVADSRLTGAERRSAWSAGLGNALLTVCVGAAALSSLVVGSHSDLGAETFAVIVLTPLALVDVLGGIPLAARLALRVHGSLSRIHDVLTAPVPVASPDGPDSLPTVRDLQVRRLRAGYGSDPDALCDVNLDVPEGSRVIVTGPSGSGKSTLAAVLLRFLDPRDGEITLGGTDVKRLDSDGLRAAIGLLTQQSHAFDTSIRENLLLASPGAADLQLWDALHQARLGEFVEGLPAGLDTLVGEHGARLSGGELQRLAFARLLLAHHDVLILDEPTEQLDDRTARELLADVFSAAARRSVVLLTHRPELAPQPLPNIVTLRSNEDANAE